MRSSHSKTLTTIALCAIPLASRAAIKRLDLTQMLACADNAVVGKIVDRQVFRADHPTDGTMYFTTITVQGTSLVDARDVTVPITYLGGFLTPDDGTTTSEMPPDSVTALGRNVVAFYVATDDMGYGVSGNALYASHGGVFSIVDKQARSIVLGQGDGYAIDANISVGDLRKKAQGIAAELVEQGKQFK